MYELRRVVGLSLEKSEGPAVSLGMRMRRGERGGRVVWGGIDLRIAPSICMLSRSLFIVCLETEKSHERFKRKLNFRGSGELEITGRGFVGPRIRGGR